MAIGKTNININFPIVEGEINNGVDLPTHPGSISANGGNGNVTIALSYTNINYITGVRVCYKTDGYPTSPSDGQFIDVAGAAQSIKITSLTNTLTYYFRIFLYNEVDSIKYYQTDITNARITEFPRTVKVTGVTPYAKGSNYIVIRSSCNFTLSAPSGTRIIIGGGGQGGQGGETAPYSKSNYPYETVNGVSGNYGTMGNPSRLTIGDQTYTSSNTAKSITTFAGIVCVGGTGGDGGMGGDGKDGTTDDNGDYTDIGYKGGQGGYGGVGGFPIGNGGTGGQGGYGGDGSLGGDGGIGGTGGYSNGGRLAGSAGSVGYKNNKGQGGQGGEGGTGGIEVTGNVICYCRGGKGGTGGWGPTGGNNFHNETNVRYGGIGGSGGTGGQGGCAAQYTLSESVDNVSCSLIIGTGGIGGTGGKHKSYSNVGDGQDGFTGDPGILIIEWD